MFRKPLRNPLRNAIRYPRRNAIRNPIRNQQAASRNVVGVLMAGFVAAGAPARAQQAPPPLRDFAMVGGNYYLRAPEFVPASKATFLRDDDHVIGVEGEGVAKAYPAAAVTWHHGLEDHLGKVPIFLTW